MYRKSAIVYLNSRVNTAFDRILLNGMRSFTTLDDQTSSIECKPKFCIEYYQFNTLNVDGKFCT